MIGRRKKLTMSSWIDLAVDDKDRDLKFYIILGDCVKCGEGPNSLVWFDFMENRRDKNQSIFRTYCLCCGNKDMYMSRDVVKMIEGPDSGPPIEPV